MLDQQLVRVVIALCEDVGTPLALTVKSFVEEEKWLELQKLKVSPASYRDGESYFWDACVVDLLRKAQIDTTHDKRAEAVKTFWDCEAQNYKTNARLSRFLPESLLIEDSGEDAILEFIREWRKELDCLLGTLPRTLCARFGKGATYADRGKLITIPDKMSVLPLLTGDAWWIKIFWSDTAWCRRFL